MDEQNATETNRPFRVGDWLVNPALDEISHVDLVVKLEPRMVRLLARLAASPGEVVSTNQLLQSVWSDVVVGPASVYQAISQLRKLLGDTGSSPTYIATIPKKGYRLVAPVTSLDSVTYASLPEPPGTVMPHRKWRFASRTTAATVTLLAVAMAGLWLIVHSDTNAPLLNVPPDIVFSDSNSHTIAVLPFQSVDANEPGIDAATTATTLLRERLAESADTRVIASFSSSKAVDMGADLPTISDRLRARYLIRGETQRLPDSVRMTVTVYDALSRREIWSSTRDAPILGLGEANELLSGELARLLRIALPSRRRVDAVDPYAYPLYANGQARLSFVTWADNQAAQQLLTRSLAMAPDFARAHLALGQAITQAERIRDHRSRKAPARALEAIRRAMDLDPNLGAAWSERALLETRDPKQAEQLHVRGLHKAPNEVFGYWAYSQFLTEQNRGSEAINMLDRARAIDPLLPGLNIIKKGMVLTQENDVAEYEHLLRETIEIAPDNWIALFELGQVRFRNGELAEGVLLAERAAKAEQHGGAPLMVLAHMYLALGMPEASSDATKHAMFSFMPKLQLHVYRRDTDAAMALAKANTDETEFWEMDSPSFGDAVRDYALAKGSFEEAVALLESQFDKSKHLPLIQRKGVGLALAHVLILQGDDVRGLKIAREILAAIDEQNRIGQRMYTIDRAKALLLLGNVDSALLELEAIHKAGLYVSWWYPAERDPLFSVIRDNPRFRAIVDRANAHRDQQQKLVEQLSREGEIPQRPPLG
jgi:transcriptional activator of cad operon